MKARTLTVLLGAFVLSTALAAVPAAAEVNDPVLVWGVSAVTDLPGDQVDAVASWLPGEVSRTTGLEVVGENEVDEAIDLALDNGECRENNMACVVEVARALDVPEAVSGDIGVVNGVYILTLRRVDAINAKVIKQVSAQTNQGVDVLIQSMSDMIATLYNIPHNQVGTVRTMGSNNGYDYVVITYGPWFSWIEPVVWYNHYPWWWTGHIHYYHHHHAWWGWHHRHPHGRPHHDGPRRPYRDRHSPDDRHDGDRHDGDRGDGDRGDIQRPSDGGAGEKGHRQDGASVNVNIRPMPKNDGNALGSRPPRNDVPVNNRGGLGANHPATQRPDRNITPPRDAVQKPQTQRPAVQAPYQQKPVVDRPSVRPGNAPAVGRPSTGHGQPAVRGVTTPSKSGKKQGSGSATKPGSSSGKSKSSGARGFGGKAGGGAVGTQPAGGIRGK